MTSPFSRIANHPLAIVSVVAFALCIDYLLYGVVTAVAPSSPVRVTSEDLLGLLYGGYAIGVLLATPLFGYLGDRIGCRKPMLAGVGLSFLATILFWLAPNFILLLLARVCQGAAAAASWTAGMALVAEHYPEKRVQMIGVAMMGSTAGSVLGPTLGGWLCKVGGYSLPFEIFAVLVCIDGLLRFFLLPKQVGPGQKSPDWRTLLGDRSVLVAASAVILAAVGWGIIEPLVPVHLQKMGEGSPATLGLVVTIATIAYGAVAPFVGFVTDRLTIRGTTYLGIVLMAVSLPLLSLAGNAWAAGAWLCVVSVSYAFLLNPSSAELGNAVDRRGLHCYAAVYAVYNIAYSLGMLGADIFASAAAPKLGFTWSLVSVSAMILCCLPLVAWAQSSNNKEQDAPPAEATKPAARKE